MRGGVVRWGRWTYPLDALGLRPRLDAQGAIGGLVLFIEEITERKEMEARIDQADRLATVGTLVRGMSHEINNPLAVVLNNLEFLTAAVSSLPVHALAAESERERFLHIDLPEALADALGGSGSGQVDCKRHERHRSARTLSSGGESPERNAHGVEAGRQ